MTHRNMVNAQVAQRRQALLDRFCVDVTWSFSGCFCCFCCQLQCCVCVCVCVRVRAQACIRACNVCVRVCSKFADKARAEREALQREAALAAEAARAALVAETIALAAREEHTDPNFPVVESAPTPRSEASDSESAGTSAASKARQQLVKQVWHSGDAQRLRAGMLTYADVS